MATILFLNPDSMFVDIHTHQFKEERAYCQVLACSPEDFPAAAQTKASNKKLSVGIHPWQASKDVDKTLLQAALSAAECVFMGEIGLDKTCPIHWDDQVFCFEQQLKIADEMKLPVIIHCVRAMPEILAQKKRFKNIPAWIVHGFRGKAETATQWIKNGFHLSFGVHQAADALKACPLDRLFIESDESEVDISLLYKQAADRLSIPMEELSRRIESHFNELIGR